MKKFDNMRFPNEGNKTTGPDGEPFKSYIDVLIFAVLQPDAKTQPHGFSPKESYDTYKFVDKLEKLKDKEKIELEDAEFEKLKSAFNRVRSGASREMAEMYEYFNKIK